MLLEDFRIAVRCAGSGSTVTTSAHSYLSLSPRRRASLFFSRSATFFYNIICSQKKATAYHFASLLAANARMTAARERFLSIRPISSQRSAAHYGYSSRVCCAESLVNHTHDTVPLAPFHCNSDTLRNSCV